MRPRREDLYGEFSKRVETTAEWVACCPGCGRAGRGHRNTATGRLERVEHGATRAGAVSFCTRTPRSDAMTPVRLGPEEADATGQTLLV